MGLMRSISPRQELRNGILGDSMGEIQFPITVKNIVFDDSDIRGPVFLGGKAGEFVAIRPVQDEKTYLGLLLGEIAISMSVGWKEEEGELHVRRMMYNPAIFVFDLNKIVFGAESWWGTIKSESDLRKITNEDIENIWYVKALKALHEKGGEADIIEDSGS
jgi:hypothetical protein